MPSVMLRASALVAALATASLLGACDAGRVVPEDTRPPEATTDSKSSSASAGLTSTKTSSSGTSSGSSTSGSGYSGSSGSTSSGSTASGDKIQTMSITAKDYAFDAPASIPSGLTALLLKDASPVELHQASLAKLSAGQTISDFLTTLMTPTAGVTTTFVAGPQAIAPGDETGVTTFLEPGSYVMLCFIPSPDGTPHFAKGMVAPLTVADSGAPVVDLPAADTSISAGEFAFIDAPPSTAGRHVFRFENKGQQDHEVVLVELDPGMTAIDFVKSFDPAAPPGPPPGRPMGGVTGASPGARAMFEADLEAGARYAYICFVSDPESGKTHAELGMTREFSVK